MEAKRPFAVFDIDGTLVRWQLYHAVADALARQGYVDPKLRQKVLESRMQWKRRTDATSFKDYERQLILAYENILEKLPIKQFQAAVDTVFDEYKDQVYTYTRELIKELKSKNYFLMAISGSQTEIIAKIADYYGFDDYVGTVYEQADGSFTGEKIIGSMDKAKTLRRLVKQHGLSMNGSYAVGDSLSDAAMLELVENPIAFNPERELFEIARKNSWKVVVERKNMIYRLEPSGGYTYLLA